MKRFELVKVKTGGWAVRSNLTKKLHHPLGGKCSKRDAQVLLKGLKRLAQKGII